MSRLTDLIARARAKDAALGEELEKEFKALTSRRAFGLNFERHTPESVELPGRLVRKGDKVRILSPRGTTKKGDQTLWKVIKTKNVFDKRMAELEKISDEESQKIEVEIHDLIVVAEFQDYIYPGLVSTGKVSQGNNKPYHTVINGENFHVLEALTYTHKGKVDVIYIDPPYNTGAKDWKYNNDYVESEDLYRHSKWLAFIERRLIVAKDLLRVDNSVLIVTIDEKEYLRLGLLLEQLFPEANMQMISSAINPKGSSRNGFRRSDEYIFILMFGDSRPLRVPLSKEWDIYPDVNVETIEPSEGKPKEKAKNKSSKKTTPEWTSMMRRGTDSLREDVPNGFYPIYVKQNENGRAVVDSVGEALPKGIHEAPEKEGLVAVLPIRSNRQEGRWQVVSRKEFKNRLNAGRIRVGRKTHYGYVINYLPDGAYKDVISDKYTIEGYDEDGSIIAFKNNLSDEEMSGDYDESIDDDGVAPTQWHLKSHNSSENGTTLINNIIGKLRVFDYAKSLYAVEDVLNFFVENNKDAIILDFFAGSGTTGHAVMRLNKRDEGRRQSILVTNNEVSSKTQSELKKQGYRAGDVEWEEHGICESTTKPRVRYSIIGKRSDGVEIEGDYKYNDIFPISEGLKENAEFFTLTYETPIAVRHNIAFERIAPLLWMRAGSQGSRIDKISIQGWDVAETYGILLNLDQAIHFCKAIKSNEKSLRIAYIITDDDRRFQAVTRHLPDSVEPVRLYESYLSNFRFSMGR